MAGTTVGSIIKEISKKYGDVVLPDSDELRAEIQRIPTGLVSLDFITCGGIPRGRITEVFGDEGSGKSTLCLLFARQAQKSGEHTVYIDMEGTLTGSYAEKVGLDLNTFHIIYPSHGDEALEIMKSFLQTDDVALVIVDSVASLVPSDEQEREAGASTIGMQARLMSSTLRKINPLLRKNKIALVFTNQIRYKIGVYGNPETTPGGAALKFFSTLRIKTSTSEGRKIKDNAVVIGKMMTAQVIKNKLGSAYGKTEYPYLYGTGFDTLGDMFDFATKHGMIKSAGAWYSWADEERLGQGRNNSIEMIRNNGELLAKLETLCQRYIEENLSLLGEDEIEEV